MKQKMSSSSQMIAWGAPWTSSRKAPRTSENYFKNQEFKVYGNCLKCKTNGEIFIEENLNLCNNTVSLWHLSHNALPLYPIPVQCDGGFGFALAVMANKTEALCALRFQWRAMVSLHERRGTSVSHYPQLCVTEAKLQLRSWARVQELPSFTPSPLIEGKLHLSYPCKADWEHWNPKHLCRSPLVGRGFHAGRYNPRRTKATTPGPCPAHKARMLLWDKQALCSSGSERQSIECYL